MPTKLRVKLIQVEGYHGKLVWRVDLPTYRIVQLQRNQGNGKPESAIVEVPDDECDEKSGKLDKQKIRHKYRGQPKWDHDKVGDDVKA